MKDQRKEKQRLKERRMKNTRKKAALRQKYFFQHPTVLLAVKSLPRFLSTMKNFQNIREEKMI